MKALVDVSSDCDVLVLSGALSWLAGRVGSHGTRKG